MSRIRCFWLEPAGIVRLSLRRYVSGANRSPCSAGFYHNALTLLAEIPNRSDETGRMLLTARQAAGAAGIVVPDASAWPVACACGYQFTESDTTELFQEELYRRGDTGDLTTLEEAPPGAMWDAVWMKPHYTGPDGRCLYVKTPAGEWLVDGPATNGNGWTRTGEVPRVTARPSIGILGEKGQPFRYHGFLTEGWLIEC